MSGCKSTFAAWTVVPIRAMERESVREAEAAADVAEAVVVDWGASRLLLHGL